MFEQTLEDVHRQLSTRYDLFVTFTSVFSSYMYIHTSCYMYIHAYVYYVLPTLSFSSGKMKVLYAKCVKQSKSVVHDLLVSFAKAFKYAVFKHTVPIIRQSIRCNNIIDTYIENVFFHNQRYVVYNC